MQFLKKLIWTLLIVLIVLTLTSFLLPGQVIVTRSNHINAAPEKIYPFIASLKKFQEWSPWAAHDPNMKLVFSGPDSGTGAQVSWQSLVSSVGSGEQKITRAQPNKMVETALDFGDKGKATARLLLKPENSGTKVTWGLVSDLGYNPLKRWMGLLMFDRMIGPEYVKGLKKLKKIVESQT